MLGESLHHFDIKAITRPGHEIGVADAQVAKLTTRLDVLEVGRSGLQADQGGKNQQRTQQRIEQSHGSLSVNGLEPTRGRPESE